MKFPQFPSAFPLILLLIFALACESEETEEEDDKQEEMMDADGPVVKIENLSEVIETETTFILKLEDDSEIVETVVKLDEKTIAESSDKNLTITIDPFEHPIGSLSLTIISRDKAGNETTVDRQVELKRLLIRVPSSNISDVYWWEHYVIINSSDGPLIDFKKVIPYQETSIYASESFSNTEFVASLFSYPISENPNTSHRMYSFADVLPGTILPTKEEIEDEDNFVDFPAINTERQLTIQTDNDKEVRISGHGYFVQQQLGEEYNLGYSDTVDSSFFFAHNLDYTTADTRNSYKYSVIKENESQYDLQEFLVPDEFYEVEIPEELKTQPLGNFSCHIRGFRTEEDYSNRAHHDVLNLGTANINIFESGLHVPLFEEFEIYNKLISGNIGDGYTLATRQKGLEYKPLPDKNVQQNGQEVLIMGQVDEVLFDMRDVHFSEDAFTTFSWQYFSQQEEQLKIPFFDFEVPEAIEQILNGQNLSSQPKSTDGTGIGVRLIEIPNYTNYTNRMFEHNYYFHYREWYSLELRLGGS